MKTLFKWLGCLLLIFVVAGGIYYSYQQLNAAPVKGNLKPISTPVVVSAVKVANIPIQISALGTIFPEQQTFITAQETGYIKGIYFTEGQYVPKNTLLIQLDDATAKANLQADQAQARYTQDNYQRYINAEKFGAVSNDDLEKALAAHQTALANVEKDQVILDNTQLRAPFAGYVGAQTINVGDLVQAGQKLTQLINDQRFNVEYQVPEQYATRLKLGQVVSVKFDQSGEKDFWGKVVFINDQIDSTTGLISEHAVMDNPKLAVTAGELVQIKQTIGTKKNAILVPELALVAIAQNYSVYMVKNGKAVSVPVTIGTNYDGWVEITRGLELSDKIITQGAHIVRDGMLVHVLPASETPG
jgi:membrane fusion protein (multidrug efflux system)